jgi:hypothetical protein
MPRFRHWALVLALLGILVPLTAVPAFALYPQLSTKLSGPAIGGVTPSGDAKLDQSRLPDSPSRLDVRVQNVNLPDGTLLDVYLTDCHAGTSPVGSFTLSGRKGQASISVPTYCPIGRTSSIYVKQGTTIRLSGGSPWQT